MIFTRRGIAIDDYPAVKDYLRAHRRRLEPRPRDHAGGTWPGRKPGNYQWYEIQDTTDYFADFEQPKIIWQEIQFHPRYAIDRAGLYINNKAFALATDDPWLLACLNSPAMWWHNWRYLVHLKDEALSPAGDKMARVPIPTPSAEQAEATAGRVEAIVALTRETCEANTAVLERLRAGWAVDAPGRALAEPAQLEREGFCRAVALRRGKGQARLSPAGLGELRELYDEHIPPIRDRRAQIGVLEREIAAAVHAAYGLEPDDLALLRATAPPRMPPPGF